LIWFLIATGLIYAGLGSYTEAITLLIAVVPLVSMDAFLHRRTQASTESLGQQLAQNARVLRNGMVLNISATDLVSGYLVLLAAGESFPADSLIPFLLHK
jgi:Ca2+-transporting ATPase